MSTVNESDHCDPLKAKSMGKLKEGQTEIVMVDCANGPEPRSSSTSS